MEMIEMLSKEQLLAEVYCFELVGYSSNITILVGDLDNELMRFERSKEDYSSITITYSRELFNSLAKGENVTASLKNVLLKHEILEAHCFNTNNHDAANEFLKKKFNNLEGYETFEIEHMNLVNIVKIVKDFSQKTGFSLENSVDYVFPRLILKE